MRILTRVILSCSVFFTSVGSAAETPAEIFQEMESRKRASLSGIENFSVMKTSMGMCTLEHFEKESTESADGGGTIEYMRMVPISEVMERDSPDSPFSQASPEDLEHAADVLRQQGPRMDQAVRNEMQTIGVPGTLSTMLSNPPADKPWLSPMPGDMMENYAMMLEGAAAGKRENARLAEQAEQEAKQDRLASIAERTRIAGHDTLRNRPAIYLVAEDLDQVQTANNQEFTLDTLHLWIDSEKYVPLKMQMDGIATDGGESRAMRIEREDMAYETRPGCGSLYEPMRSVMRISGVMNAEEQAQMAEAQQQLAEFQTQMSGLTEAQRNMIMAQMGPQLEMFEKMASGGGIEIVSLRVGMRCNAGLPTKEEYMQTVPGIAQAACIGFGN